MSYIPKLPPFSARENTRGVSLPGKIPVTSVTEVTNAGSSCKSNAMGLATTQPPEMDDLLNLWLHERCVVSARGGSSMSALHRSFRRFKKFGLDADVEQMFAEDLWHRGYTPDESGMVQGLVLATDFLAALEYESAHKGLPATNGRNSMEGTTNMPMVITSKQKQFEIPTEGEHLAVLADIVDLGEEEFDYGRRDRIQLIWQVEQRGKDGKPLSVRQKPHNKSMHEKATLRKDIKRILGKDPGDTFDVESLLGVNALLEVEHYTREGRTYANITGIRRPANGHQVLRVPEDFKRMENTKRPKVPKTTNSANIHGVAVTDDDVQF